MMPQLGVLSSIHPEALPEVFNKDCLIRLGTCIAPVGNYAKDKEILKYKIKTSKENLEGELHCGEIKLISHRRKKNVRLFVILVKIMTLDLEMVIRLQK